MELTPHGKARPATEPTDPVRRDVVQEIFDAMEPGIMYLNDTLQLAYAKKTGVRPSPVALGRALAKLGAKSQITTSTDRKVVRATYREN